MATSRRSMSGLAYETIDLVAPWDEARRPIVFHHGIGTDRHIWSDWLPAVITGHPLLRFDTRGFGASDVPPSRHAWTLDAAAADLTEMMDLAGPGPVHLVGESFGGTVCLAVAARYPDRVASLTVSNTAFKGAGIAHVAGWRAALEDLGAEPWSRDMMNKRFAPGALTEAKAAWFHRVQSQSLPHVTAGIGELLARTDLTDELPAIRAPLMILSPDRSPFVTARMSVELLEFIPHAELAVIPGSRHGLPFSHGEACGHHLAAHVDRVERYLSG